jgi:hypothetical protein
VKLLIRRAPMFGDATAVALQLVASEPGAVAPPAAAVPFNWFLDTGFAGEAFAWREHIEFAGLDPDAHPDSALDFVTALSGQRKRLRTRKADLWIPAGASESEFPIRFELSRGIAFQDELIPRGREATCRPLIGMKLLRRLGLVLKLDFQNRHFSIWAPARLVRH